MSVTDFSCKSENPPQEPEVRVEVKDDGSWVRIPVTLCELHINKDGPAGITRTAKVKFPAEWGGKNITQFINGFSGIDDNEYDECRIWFHDDEPSDANHYQICHYGYIGSVGPAAETGVMKFWVYDPADLMRGVPASKTWDSPNIAQVLDYVVRDEENGFENRTIFDDIKVYIAGENEVRKKKKEIDPTSIIATDESETDEGDGLLSIGAGPFQFKFNDIIDDITETLFGSDVTTGWLEDSKYFKLNRHNLVDMMDWFAERLEAKWHFEPTPDGPVLLFDNSKSIKVDGQDKGEFSRREFIDREMLTYDVSEGYTPPTSFINRDVFEPIDVIHNQALVDIKPYNTLYLYGQENATIRGWDGVKEDFPYVKLQHEDLYNNAGKNEYSAPVVESDAIRLDDAEAEAKKEFREHLEEQTEGTITLKGDPYILPYDYITVQPVCKGTFPNADVSPVDYEVNSVTHRRAADERYKTELGVSLRFEESDIEVVESRRMKA